LEEGETTATLQLGGSRLRAIRHAVEHGGHRYIAAALVPLDALEREHSELVLALAVGVAVALFVAVVAGWIAGRRALLPLTDLASQAAAIDGRLPTGHLQTANAADELGKLTAAFNALLDRLRAALQSQRQFMADAAHELRTPVSVVRTTAQVTLARADRSEPEYRESLEVVADQSSRLTALVDSMFLLSRAEAEGIPLACEPVYLDDLVSECARARRVLAEERRVGLRVDGDDEVPLFGDDTLLRRMIGNLLDNALRHARSGVWVTATLARSGAEAVLRVRDDGAGIPPAERERIFQRFVRLDSSSPGAGLGLPIARWIAEAHQGELVLESSDGSGTCFRVSLPPAGRAVIVPSSTA
jgi:signal transduction histidine kinase